MKFEQVKAGMTLYDVHRYRMGNTTIRTMGCWPVHVVSVDEKARTARVHWNVTFNPEQTYTERQLKKLRAERPLLVKTGFFGRERLATREEKRAHAGPRPRGGLRCPRPTTRGTAR